MERSFLEYNNEVKQLGEDGFYKLESDIKAIEGFIKYVSDKLVKFDTPLERFKYLVDNNYYYKGLFDQYSEEDVLKVSEFVYSVPFNWSSFMAVSKFFNSYSMKTNDNKRYLEVYQDRITIVALYLAMGDVEEALRFAGIMIEQINQPATPTFQNAGKERRGEMISCFLTEIGDSLNAITFNWGMTAQLSKIGGGVSNNLTYLRAKSESIKEIENTSSGVVPNMKIHEDISTYINQLGQRDGSFADYISIGHADVMDFLDVKKISADEKVKMMRLSIGVIAPSIFFDKAFNDEDWYVFYPLSVFKEYGVHFADMDLDEMYEELLANPNVRKEKCELSARELLNKIATLQIESGYPYLFMETNANKNHPLKRLGRVKFSNLCTEIAQLSTVSVINDYGEEDEIGYDVQCCLSSLNIVNAIEKDNGVEHGSRIAIRMLSNVLKLTDIKNAPAIMKANRELRAVGLGVMNYTGFLFKNNIPYGSQTALAIADIFGMMMNYYTLDESMLLAKKESPFVGFEKSDYADGSYFDDYGYLVEDYHDKYKDVISEYFPNHYVPTIADWERLKGDVMEHGIYNAYRMAIAPTQSISYIQNATSSVMPNTQVVEERTYGDSKAFYPMPYLNSSNYLLYARTAYNINQMDIIDTVAVWQKHIDQAISCILFVHDVTPTDELAKYIAYAHHVGLKSLYYIRALNTSQEECEACAI